MHKLLWLETAKSDLLSIIDYISDDNPDAAQQLKDVIEEKVKKLSQFPRIGRNGRVDGTRELPVSANYLIIYDEVESAIRILRVLHCAQQWPPFNQ